MILLLFTVFQYYYFIIIKLIISITLTTITLIIIFITITTITIVIYLFNINYFHYYHIIHYLLYCILYDIYWEIPVWQFSQSDRCRNALATDLQEWYAKGAARVQRRLASQGHGFVTHRLWELWESHFPFPEQWCIPQIQYFIYVYLSCSLNSVILEENMPL